MIEKQSKSRTLNTTDYRKILIDCAYFFLVPISFYLVAVLGIIGQENHILSLKDFVPTNIVMISIVSWLLNQMLNAIRKFVSGK